MNDLSRLAEEAEPMASDCASPPEAVCGPCLLCPVRETALCRGLSAADLQRVYSRARYVVSRPAGTTLFAQGERCETILIVRAGWAVVYKLFADGRRQIIRFAMPGDVLGFEGNETVGMLYTAEALTDLSVCAIRRHAFTRACQELPRLSVNVARALAHEALEAWNHVGALGQQTAKERIASLLLELHRRVTADQPPDGTAVHLPLNQVHIADATGLTSVHVCRTLKRMRAAGILTYAKGTLRIEDGERLRAIAQLDPDIGR